MALVGITGREGLVIGLSDLMMAIDLRLFFLLMAGETVYMLMLQAVTF